MKTKAGDMSMEKDKLEIIKWVTTLKDETSIERLKMLKDSRAKADWWEQISDEEKNAVDKGLADIKAGRLKPHQEVKKLYEKWL
jgi:predicted transcriptional regulator